MLRDVHALIDDHGGLIAPWELHREGFDRARIARLLAQGSLHRIRQGWYSHPDIDLELAAAARVGGRLSCVSRLRRAGIWVIGDASLHLRVDAHDCELRDPADPHRRLAYDAPVVVHWRGQRPARSPVVGTTSRLETGLVTALLDGAACLDPEFITAAADSLLRSRPGLRGEIRRRAVDVNERARDAIRAADGICESGVETLFWMRTKRLSPDRQVRIPSVGRVDFLFGERLVVEVDGRAFHDAPSTFERDRRRDALLSVLGYRVLRFSAHQVMERWLEVDAAIRAAIARGDRF